MEYDAQTGLYHTRARYYSPTLQRFVSEDPLGFGGGDVNLFAYAGNDPINGEDTLGLSFAFYGEAAPLIGASYAGAESGGVIIEEANFGLGGGIGARPALGGQLGGTPSGSALVKGGVSSGQIVLAQIKTLKLPGYYTPTPTPSPSPGGEPPLPLMLPMGMPTPEVLLWSATSTQSASENARSHWAKHANEFPEYSSEYQYIKAANEFVTNPPPGTLSKVRGGDTLLYNPSTNTFAVRNPNGAPRTMFRPTLGINYWNLQ
jgi:RHS repeat-associated protein